MKIFLFITLFWITFLNFSVQRDNNFNNWEIISHMYDNEQIPKSKEFKKDYESCQIITPNNMVFVKGGTFQMGRSNGRSNEKPTHSVTLNDFYIGAYEVTFYEFDEYCNNVGKKLLYDENNGRGKLPVIHVSWNDAIEYCNWRSKQENLTPVYSMVNNSVQANFQVNGYRLPTEAEWEYAARSRGKDEKWAGTNMEMSLSLFANSSSHPKKIDAYEFTAPVGSFLPNSLGIFDMSGNVSEWCWDWEAKYSYNNKKNPKGPYSGTQRITRGGSHANGPSLLRCSVRRSAYPESSRFSVGFRLAKSN